MRELRRQNRTLKENKLRTNLGQTEDKLRTNLDFSQLVGMQRKLLTLIYFSMRKNQSNNSERLSIEYLVESSGSTFYSVRRVSKD